MKLANFASTLAVVCLAASNVNAISVHSDSEISAYTDAGRKMPSMMEGQTTFIDHAREEIKELEQQPVTNCKDGYNKVLAHYQLAYEYGVYDDNLRDVFQIEPVDKKFWRRI